MSGEGTAAMTEESDEPSFEPDAARDPESVELARTWARRFGGVRGFFSDINHKTLGMRFLVTALIFFLLGGVEALVMRLQLSRAENTLVGPDLYNQLFTMHGSTMMFLFAVPVMEGLGLYFVPLMIGTRNAAFPRLNAFAYYTYLTGGILLYAGFLLNTGPDAGWFAYVPLSGPEFSPGKRVDIWAQMITFTELSALSGAVGLIATILKHRCPGMSLDRMPLFVWSILIQSIMIVFAMPAVMLGSLMLAMDRLVSTHFFNHAEGGDPLLWQHLFWFFGHPEVYIIFIPALGILSSLIVTFTRREIFGYPAMVVSLAATAFVGFGVWVHHMFATGIPKLGASFFTAASILIVVPTGVQFFCWIATLWGGSIRLRPPMLFALGFFGVFLIGGLTGVMLASVPLDLQVHDTYFVVAHLHYVLIGGAVFPLLGGIHYWYPKFTGRMLHERLAHLTFWLFFAGFNLLFFPMHMLGLMGMPRRVFTYGAEQGFAPLNQLASLGAAILTVSILLLLINMARSRRKGVVAGDDPWQADTLEWGTPSPVPAYNFAPLPTVSGRYGLWTRVVEQPHVRGVRSDRREVLVTRLLDGDPDHRTELPGDTIWPLLVALGAAITFIVAIFTPWGVPAGSLLTGAALIGWFWPKRPHREELVDEQPRRTQSLTARRASEKAVPAGPTLTEQRSYDLNVSQLPTAAFGSRDPLWWGVIGLITIESMVFALLWVSYFYVRGNIPNWPPARITALNQGLALGNLAILLVSCVPMYMSTKAAKRGSLKGMRWTLVLSTLLALGFLAVRALEFASLEFRWDSHVFGSVFWLLIGLHTLHMITATIENLMLIVLLYVGPLEEKHLVDVTVNGAYWYFVVAVWLVSYGVLFVHPALSS